MNISSTLSASPEWTLEAFFRAEQNEEIRLEETFLVDSVATQIEAKLVINQALFLLPHPSQYPHIS